MLTIDEHGYQDRVVGGVGVAKIGIVVQKSIAFGKVFVLTAGLNDTAYHLNGLHYSAGGNYLSIQGDDSLFSQDQIALSMAFRADVPGQGGDLFRIHTAMQIDVLDSGDVSFKLIANALGESGTIASLGVDVTDGAWHHIALSYDALGERMAGYLDGNFVGEIAVSGPTKALEYWNPLIGNPWSGGFTGLIDEVNIYDSALTAADVAALHDAFLGGGQSSPPNASPIANDDVATTLEDTPLVLTPVELTGNDVDADGDLLTISDVSLVSGNGSVALLSSGLVLFTPTANDSGTALLEYEIQDGRGGQSTGQVTVTVTPINDAPMATAASFAILEDAQIGSLIGTIGAFDPEGQVLSYAITAGNDDNAFAVNVSGELLIQSNANLDAAVQSQYDLAVTITDSEGANVIVDTVINVSDDISTLTAAANQTYPTAIVVDDSAELNAALLAAVGGETLLLRPDVDYAVSAQNITVSDTVTITSLDANNAANITSLQIVDSNMLLFDNLRFEYRGTCQRL